MSSLQIQQVLAEMRALQSRVSGVSDALGSPPGVSASGAAAPGAGQPADFASLLKSTVDNVATMQNQATAMAESYEAGDKSADITKVMLEVQKAGLAFRAMTEVRNKLVDAYQAVMNMSV
jgi:flagellar hook-basal body complex protein FliE